jgi:hypothetical protein
VRLNRIAELFAIAIAAGAELHAQTPEHPRRPAIQIEIEKECVEDLGRRFARLEGWGASWTLVRRYHNPGALRLRSGEYRRFESDEAGWSALFRDITGKRERGWSWIRIITAWSENPEAYRRELAGFGCKLAP